MVEILGWIVICVIVADFITGVAHWFEDTYCLDGYPVVGKLICEPNIDHHVDPNLMVRTGNFFTRNYLQWIMGIIGYTIAYFLGLGYWQVGLTMFIASFGNEVHRWNHTTKLGWFPNFMKNSGLVQSQKQHSMHHKPPFLKYYCTIISFTNEVLEAVNFWRRLEWVISLFGLHPTREGRRDMDIKVKKEDS